MAKFNAKIMFPLWLIIGAVAYLLNSYVHWKEEAIVVMPKVEISSKNSFNKTLKIASDNNLAPLSFLDENGNPSGFYIELTNEIANRAGYNVEYLFYPWQQAVEKLKHGEIDILMGYINVFSDQYKVNKNISVPLCSDFFSIFSNTPINSVKELKGKKVAAKKFNPNEVVKSALAQLDLVPFESHKEALLAVSSGKADVALCPNSVGNFLRLKENIPEINNTLKLTDIFSCYIVPDERSELLSKLNIGITSCITEGIRATLENKWSKPILVEKSSAQFFEEYKLTIGLIAVLCILLLVFVVLSKRKEEKTIEKTPKAADAPQNSESANTDKAKTDELILSRISRDFRTPINGIMGLTKIARMNMEDPDKIKEYLNKIDASSQRLLSIFTDFLNLSQIKNGKARLYSAPLNLIDLIKDCEAYVLSLQEISQIKFQCDYSGLLHKAVIGDRVHLRQILINILDNAVKFTPAGGTVSFKIAEGDSTDKTARIFFEIQDSGKGMSADFLKSLFGEFTQEKTTLETERTGIGIGLFIAKSYADMMGATINVISDVDKGSKFTLSVSLLPCAMPEARDDVTKDSLKNTHVLIVEDNDINMEIAEEFLAEEGIITTPAENGEEAVNIFSSSPDFYFQAILMDIMMPVMDGYEATKIIRSMPREDAKSIPIIAMTANALSEDHHKSLAIGMNAHLTKPIDQNLLISTLCELIAIRKN